MSSLNDKATVDEIITANGKHGITYIIEYKNIFDGRPTWKLCKDVYEYDHAMKTGAFIEPKLIWSKI